jgi:hypothetical protein
LTDWPSACIVLMCLPEGKARKGGAHVKDADSAGILDDGDEHDRALAMIIKRIRKCAL